MKREVPPEQAVSHSDDEFANIPGLMRQSCIREPTVAGDDSLQTPDKPSNSRTFDAMPD